MRIVLLLMLALAAGCAPMQSFRPADGLMEGRTAEVGMGGAVIGPRPYVEESARGAGQLWVTGRVNKRVTLSAMGAFDLAAVAAGGGLRVDVVRSKRVAAALEGELGFAWAALVLPASLRLVGEARLYSGPRLGLRNLNWAVEVPLGVSMPLDRRWMVRAEYVSSWVELQAYQHRHSLGLGLAYQF